MSEEEKKAYEYFKNTTENFLNYPFVEISKSEFNKYDFIQLKTLLDLIEKQNAKIECALDYLSQYRNVIHNQIYFDMTIILKGIKEGD